MATPDAITQEARFFLEPGHPRQRQYEALRAYFVEGLPSAEAARRVVAALDRKAHAERREIDRRLAADVLDELSGRG